MLEILDKESEEFLAVGMLGGAFLHHAVKNLLVIHHCWDDVRYWMLYSALARQDKRGARIYLQDWKAEDHKPKAHVSKFIPGEHFHVLDKKFSSLSIAQDYLSKRGYRYGGLHETYIDPKIGD